MIRSMVLFICVAVIGFAGSVHADMFSTSPSCFKPSKPFEFQNQWEYENFIDEVDMYRMCIEAFVDEQQRAAQNHLDAAQQATEEWNNFVNFELE
ncbi:MAG: hypothetical protein U5R46_15310 [Gammaproteobacteria bacterium]|nr:hypothetical protein [Gammaproteobacteria bacterium]